MVLGAGAGSVLAGCSSGSSSPTTTSGSSTPASKPGTPKKGGALVVGTIAEIDGFYPPINHWDTNGFLYANAVFDPLMAVAADGSVQPYLAKTMTSNSTFDTWTMTLRPGVKFNDGSDLTSAVVKANFDALAGLRPHRGGPQAGGVGDHPRRHDRGVQPDRAQPDVPGRAHHPGRLRGGRSDDPELDQTGGDPPGRHRALHLRRVAAERPLHRHPQPELLEDGAPLPRLDHLQADSRHRPAGVHPPVRRRRHDRVGGPHHHHPLLRFRRVRLPADRQSHRHHRPADLRLHHAEHRGGSHQRPVHPPGAGQGHEPEGGPDHHRR